MHRSPSPSVAGNLFILAIAILFNRKLRFLAHVQSMLAVLAIFILDTNNPREIIGSVRDSFQHSENKTPRLTES